LSVTSVNKGAAKHPGTQRRDRYDRRAAQYPLPQSIRQRPMIVSVGPTWLLGAEPHFPQHPDDVQAIQRSRKDDLFHIQRSQFEKGSIRWNRRFQIMPWHVNAKASV
jgi:hypothetical protein